MTGSDTSAQFAIVGIDGDELIVFAGGFRPKIGGTSTDVRWTPYHAHRYLDGYAIGTNDMIGKGLFFAENPQLRAELERRHNYSMGRPVVGIDGDILARSTPSVFGHRSTLASYLNGTLDDEAINIITEINVAATYPQLKCERDKRIARAQKR